VGSNSISAIVFDDRASAETTLGALSHSSDIVAAAIYTAGDAPFAQYPANGAIPIERRPLAQTDNLAHWASGADILIASRIEFQGKPIGVVYLQAHLRGLRRQAIQYGVIAAGVLLICLAVALLVGTVFRRLLAKPIVSLSSTARLVSRYRDYSLRFTPDRSYYELASLTEAFNEMLAEIQRRDEALEQARAGLELRVEERTAELQAANRELEAFSYTVAHDLRGPLQSISNICFLIQQNEQVASSAGTASMLTQLGLSVRSMSAMIDDLLDLSRSTSVPLESKQTDLSLLATSVLERLAMEQPERKVETIVARKCLVNADPGLMQVVVQNLLRNAWKFTGRSDHARIEFGCSQQGKVTTFYVRDNGAGFDQRFAEKLFKPFQRLHANSDFPGTGIGLATVEKIIRRHGGEVWAEGEVDKGATFYFTLEPREK
jgi:signal transduction histidine kinase